MGNNRPKSLTAIEDHILSAAIRLSHGDDLEATMSQLQTEITGCEDALTRDLEAANWFDLATPTNLLTSGFEHAVSDNVDKELYLGELFYSSQVKRTRLIH